MLDNRKLLFTILAVGVSSNLPIHKVPPHDEQDRSNRRSVNSYCVNHLHFAFVHFEHLKPILHCKIPRENCALAQSL